MEPSALQGAIETRLCTKGRTEKAELFSER